MSPFVRRGDIIIILYIEMSNKRNIQDVNFWLPLKIMES